MPVLKKYISATGKELLTGKTVELSETIECRVRDKSGNWRYLESTTNLMGKEILAVSRDITDRKKAEDALHESEAKYSTLVEQAQDVILIVQDNVFKFVNSSIEKIGGYTKKEIIGKPFINFIAPGYKKLVAERYIAHMAGKKIPSFYGAKILCKDGTIKDVEISAGRIQYNGRSADMGIIRDITERKKAEEKLMESEEKYSGFFKTSRDATFITSKDGRLLENNDAFMKILGYETRDELLKIKISEHYKNPGDRKKHIQIIGQQGFTKEFPTDLRKKDGSIINVLITSVVIKDKNGNVTGFQGTIRDITEKKKAEEIIKQQNTQLKKLDRIKSDFLNVTSHELRTPMSSIKGYVQMILKQTLGEVSKEQQNALKVVLRNTNRLDHLIQDILDISRLESGTMKFIPEQTDLEKMVKEAVETMQSVADLKEIKINTDLENLPELIIDQERVKQVIINLVNNAIKFSPGGSIINIKTKRERDDILFEIQDFGKGIPKCKQKKIFETFYQVGSGMDRKFGGAGLGLAISRGIIVSHGGKLDVGSNVGKGSTFRFTLPIKPVENLECRFKEADIFGLENNE